MLGLFDRRRWSLLALGLAVLATLVFAACDNGTSGSDATSADSGAGPGKAQRGGDLVIARPEDVLTFDPNVAIDDGSIRVIDQIYEPLVRPSGDGKTLKPWLAKSWTTSDDHKTWTFKLRPGVQFSNGKPLTADDVVWTLDRVRKGEGPLQFILASIKSIEAPSPDTVVFTTKYAWAPFLADLAVFANGILPANLDGKSPAEFFKNPIGTGPFTLDHWSKGNEVVLARNAKYWQKGKPYLDKATMKVVADDNTRIIQLRGGQADVAANIPPASIAQLKSTPGIELGLYQAWRVDFLLMNERRPWFKDPHVRRAIAQAVDRESIVKAVMFDSAKVACSFIAPGLPYYAEDTNCLKFDLAAAKAEMAKSKFPDGFTTRLLIPGGNNVSLQIGQIVQQQLKQLGIEVKIQQLDQTVYRDFRNAFKYDMLIDNWVNDIPDPDEMVGFMADPVGGGSGSYWTDYNNPKVIKLVHAAQREFDADKRAALYKEIQDAVAQDVPYVALSSQPNIWANSDKVHDFSIERSSGHRLEDVWMTP